MKIVVATNNQHKLGEFKKLLEELDIELLTMQDALGETLDIIEDGETFCENSAIKALAVSAKTDKLVFSDDSGIVVDALDGAPGIYSARYAGEGASDLDNLNKLIDDMKDCENRKAQFVCVITLAKDGEIIADFTGEVEGHLQYEADGVNGFGYDPIFVPEGFDKSFGLLSEEIKQEISHRACATILLKEFLKEI